MGNLLPINDPSFELCEVLTCLPEKFVVDFANGIDVVHDHLRIQRARTGFFSRLYDGFTGQGVRRQTKINASLADGVEGALTWLTELTASVAQSNYALTRVNERVAMIQGVVTRLAHYSADTRIKLEGLSKTLNNRCDLIAKDLARVDCEQRAERQLEQVFNKWAAGRFAMFSSAGRCYAALEELSWGDFGDYCRNNINRVREGFLDDLTNRAIRQLAIDSDLSSSLERIPVHRWTNQSNWRGSSAEVFEALSYLGNWAEPDLHPFVFTTAHLPEKLPMPLPRLCSAERVAEALVSEVFEREELCPICA